MLQFRQSERAVNLWQLGKQTKMGTGQSDWHSEAAAHIEDKEEETVHSSVSLTTNILFLFQSGMEVIQEMHNLNVHNSTIWNDL